MPKKRTQDFHLLPIEEQQERIARFLTRKDVRVANRELAKLVLEWLLVRSISDQEFMEMFEAAGHEGEYHEKPNITTGRRVFLQAAELPNIVKRLEDTPLDYMGALELKFVLERIMMMIEWLQTSERGLMEDAIALYQKAGEVIRQKVFTETGHYPEQFPMPHGRITGSETSKQFQLTDHQPPLF
ncbi:MAG: hypothetical protein H0X24_16195 [Ktedonobacterales bacterium]|nr:hypothetical protein [Ktedonobacterales bacterium]